MTLIEEKMMAISYSHWSPHLWLPRCVPFHLPWGRYNLGIVDLLLLTAMGEYWRRRGGTLLVALAPGVIGFILALGFGHFMYAGALPLIPFFTI
jgi:hypothetical protein